MDYKARFRKQPQSAEISLRPSAEALKLAQAYRRCGPGQGRRVKTAETVKREAVARIRQAGGDPSCAQLVLSESELQFGQYRGQTFKWLLENDVGYACSVLASHFAERNSGDRSQSPLSLQKDALASYADLFPQMKLLVRERRMREGSASIWGMDNRLLGFGVYSQLSYRALYEAEDKDIQG